MFSKRRLRFSIGAMLVLMAGVAVLLNREVQRAKAIETTINRIIDWKGQFGARRRRYIPKFLAETLPRYWAEEIYSVELTLYSKEKPIPTVIIADEEEVRHHPIVDAREFDDLLDLGALCNISKADLGGTAINQAIASRVCQYPNLQTIAFVDVVLSDNEIHDLKRAYPSCKFYIIPHNDGFSVEVKY